MFRAGNVQSLDQLLGCQDFLPYIIYLDVSL